MVNSLYKFKPDYVLYFVFFICISYAHPSYGQTTNDRLKTWNAFWIKVPATDPHAYGIYMFRKRFEIKNNSGSFIIHVSADNRYKLFVNEKLVSIGPARSDFYFWNYETIDIRPYLIKGRNTISALVWNEAELRPEGQSSFQTGFVLQGHGYKEEAVNTNESWKCKRDESYRALPVHLHAYYAAGPGELINMKDHLKDWKKSEFNDTGWMQAEKISIATLKGEFNFSYGWMLVPSALPQMEMKEERILQCRKADGMAFPSEFPAKKTAIEIPAHKHISFLLDQQYLTNAYPLLKFSGGNGAGISLQYAESLFTGAGNEKGNRDSIEGKNLRGKKDSLISDGSAGQVFNSLWWRTFRYLQLTITTNDDPLTLEDILGIYTAYPFTKTSELETGLPLINRVLDIGWRTARLCAGETYMDCPYYEQLQYIGDTRIQALVNFYNTNDDRLVRNAITQLDHSRIPEGITLSRYPSVTPQQIPTFSLWWISMLHDYWMYRPDQKFVKEKLQGCRDILAFFQRYEDSSGSVKNLPYWVFTDWVDNRNGWKAGVAPIGKDRASAIIDLQLLWTYQQAAEMEAQLGMEAYAASYRLLSRKLMLTIQRNTGIPLKRCTPIQKIKTSIHNIPIHWLY